MLLWPIWPIQSDANNLKNYWNPGKWVLILKYSLRAIQWIPAWQGLDGFYKTLRCCDLDKSCLGIGRVNVIVRSIEDPRQQFQK